MSALAQFKTPQDHFVESPGSRHPVEGDAAPPSPLTPTKRKSRRVGWLIATAIAIVALALGAARVLAPAETATVAAVAKSAPVILNKLEVQEIVAQTLVQAVRFSGPLVPSQQAPITAQISGTIDSVAVRPGDKVKAGDVLARFNLADFQARLEQQVNTAAATEAQLELARSQLEKTATLAKKGVVTQSTSEQAQSDVGALEANLAALKTQVTTAQTALANATVRAPFDGFIAERLVDPGQTVSINTKLLSLADLSQMEVQASLAAGASAGVVTGQTAEFSVNGIADRKFTATVDRINPIAAEGSRAITVYLTVDNADLLLRGGMFATGRVVTTIAPDALAVPAAAVREDQAGSYVLKVEDGALVRQMVVTGPTWNSGRLIQIDDGLAPGDTLVTAALPELVPGMTVTVQGS